MSRKRSRLGENELAIVGGWDWCVRSIQKARVRVGWEEGEWGRRVWVCGMSGQEECNWMRTECIK